MWGLWSEDLSSRGHTDLPVSSVLPLSERAERLCQREGMRIQREREATKRKVFRVPVQRDKTQPDGVYVYTPNPVGSEDVENPTDMVRYGFDQADKELALFRTADASIFLCSVVQGPPLIADVSLAFCSLCSVGSSVMRAS